MRTTRATSFCASVAVALLALIAATTARAGDDDATVPINVFASAATGDWCTLSGTMGSEAARKPVSLTFRVRRAGPDTVQLAYDGPIWELRWDDFKRADAPRIRDIFQMHGRESISGLEVADAKRTAGGREFACKKVSFVASAGGDPPVSYTMWFSADVRAGGFVAISMSGLVQGRKASLDVEVAGFGTSEDTGWHGAGMSPPLPLALPPLAIAPHAGASETVPVQTVNVAASGHLSSGGLERGAEWRGLKLPIDKGLNATGTARVVAFEEVRIFIVREKGKDEVTLRLGARPLGDAIKWIPENLDSHDESPAPGFATALEQVAELTDAMQADHVRAVGRRAPVIIDAGPDVPFYFVAAITAKMLERDITPEFASPMPGMGGERSNRDLVRGLIERAGGIEVEGTGARILKLALRIRGDARAPWGAVQDALDGAAAAGVYRFTFSVVEKGLEVDLSAAPAPAVIAVAPGGKVDMPDRPRGIVDRAGLDQPASPASNEPAIFFPGAEESDHNESMDGDQKGDDFTRFLPGSEGGVKGRQPGVNEAMGVGGGAGGAGRYGGRFGGRRNLVARGGGSQATESAVMAGLRWLARHQSADGGWHGESFSDGCGGGAKCAGTGYKDHDVGLTGLSLLAFLGAGYTNVSRETYEDPCTHQKLSFGVCVKKGLKFLLAAQDEEGCFGARTGEFMYDHAVATLAIAEAFGLTNAAAYRLPAQKGLAFISLAQNPVRGWRYTVKPGDNDTSVTGWCVAALKAGETSGLEVSRASFEGAKAWLDSVTADDGQVGYNGLGKVDVYVPGKNQDWGSHPTMTAIGLLDRILIDRKGDDPRTAKQVALIGKDLPAWDEAKHTVDLYYWFEGTLALYQADGPSGKSWQAWNEAVKGALVPHQKVRKDGCEDGSWNAAVDRWGFAGGRVGATAIGVLTLETYYRCEQVLGAKRR